VASRGRIVPHETRVLVAGKPGMVIAVHNARRHLSGGRFRVYEPAKLTVILDSGRRVVAVASEVVHEVGVDGRASSRESVAANSLVGGVAPVDAGASSDPGDECGCGKCAA
jgi:hypothetical protein